MDITLLKPGTKLTIETKNSVYQITIITGSDINIMGGMNKNGEIRYPRPVAATFIGSDSETQTIPEHIERNMKLEIAVGNTRFSTSPVLNIEIEAPDGSWYYSMDWNKI